MSSTINVILYDNILPKKKRKKLPNILSDNSVGCNNTMHTITINNRNNHKNHLH